MAKVSNKFSSSAKPAAVFEKSMKKVRIKVGKVWKKFRDVSPSLENVWKKFGFSSAASQGLEKVWKKFGSSSHASQSMEKVWQRFGLR